MKKINLNRQAHIPKNERIHYVYLRYNTKLEMGYVGKTQQTPKERQYEDMRRAKNPNSRSYKSAICKGLRESNPEDWIVTPLATTSCEILAMYLEQIYMDKYKTLDPITGYNKARAITQEKLEELRKTIDLSKATLLVSL